LIQSCLGLAFCYFVLIRNLNENCHPPLPSLYA
jgi:hypothetical protein